MSDRFKFRVWNKLGKFYESDYLKLTQDGYLRVYHDSIKFPLGDDKGAEHIVEQCTGLKDKNGNLIYEGDVLRRDTNGRIIKVAYYQGGFGWMTNYDMFICFSGHLYIEEILQHYEIIGNIHEMEVEK